MENNQLQPDPTSSPATKAKSLRVRWDKGKKLLKNRPLTREDNRKWVQFTERTLIKAFGRNSHDVSSFMSVDDRFSSAETEEAWEENWAKDMENRLAILEELIEILEAQADTEPPPSVDASTSYSKNSVFLVHGHNEATREKTARFLEKLDLKVIILHEQTTEGRSIMEQILHHSDVGYVVVLLTGDDRGGEASVPYENQQLRARQNVIFELGFFLGRLGRERVCVLREDSIEIPSDYSGVLFKHIDAEGAWKLPLAREMQAAGLDIDMNNAV